MVFLVFQILKSTVGGPVISSRSKAQKELRGVLQGQCQMVFCVAVIASFPEGHALLLLPLRMNLKLVEFINNMLKRIVTPKFKTYFRLFSEVPGLLLLAMPE